MELSQFNSNPKLIIRFPLFTYRILWLMVWLYQPAFGQDTLPDSFSLVTRVPLEATAVVTDFLGNIYVISRQNELVHLDERGLVLGRYSNNYLGRPQLIHTNSPLQLVLFYPDFQTLLILDKTLNELKRIRLADLGLPYMSALGYSSDRELWYFDEPVRRFRRINIQGKLILESSMTFVPFEGEVVKIRIQNNEVGAWTNAGRIFILDLNGHLKRQIDLEGEWISWKEDEMVFFYNQTIRNHSPKGLSGATDLSGLDGQPYTSLGLLPAGIVATNGKEVYIFRSVPRKERN